MTEGASATQRGVGHTHWGTAASRAGRARWSLAPRDFRSCTRFPRYRARRHPRTHGKFDGALAHMTGSTLYCTMAPEDGVGAGSAQSWSA